MFLSDKLNQIVAENKKNNCVLAQKIDTVLGQEIERIGKIKSYAERKGCAQRAKNALRLALNQNGSNIDTTQIEQKLNHLM